MPRTPAPCRACSVTAPRSAAPKPRRGLTVALWVVQVLLFLLFASTGVWKLTTPIPALAARFPWMGQVSPAFLRLTAVFDLLGGLGVLLPTLTRVRPGLAV